MLNSRLLTESEKCNLRDIHIAAANILGSDFMDTLDDAELDGIPSKIKQQEEGNFVGRLQELCQKNIWPPPSYEFLDVAPCLPSGFGNSKKSAKRRAAYGLLNNIIKNNLTIPQEALEYMEEETLSLVNQSNVKENKLESEATVRISSKALRGLWNAKGNKVKVPPMDNTDSLNNPCEYLASICECAKITVVYAYVSANEKGK
ncbi:unnamed protein product [Trichobilharzia regenti]|nr:unnamed protein product [Trichobilharzia regenti]